MSKAGYAAALLLIAVAGCVALTMLFPRFDASSRWGLTLDRSQSIGKAREIAKHYGVNTDGWDATVSAAEIRGVSQYLASGTGKEIAALLVPLRITVQLFDRKSDDRVVVQLGPQGQFEGYSHRQHASPANPTPPGTDPRPAAEAALADLTGPDRGKFTLLSQTQQEKEDVKFIWEAANPADPQLKLSAEVVARGNVVNEVSLKSNFAPGFLEGLNRRRGGLIARFSTIEPLLMSPFLLAATVLFLVGIVRKAINYRSAFALLAFLIVLLLVWNLSGPLIEAFRSATLDERVILDPSLANPVAVLNVLLFCTGLAILLFFVWCGGFVLSARKGLDRLLSAELLLRGRLFDRPVGTSIAVGLLAAPLIGAVPYLVAASGVIKDPDIRPVIPGFFVARMPALSRPGSVVCLTLFILFGFVAPLASAYIRRTRLAHVVWLALGIVWFAGEDFFRSPFVAAALTALILVVAYDYLYRRVDFLAVMIASLGADATVRVAGVLSQDSAGLHASGWRMVTGLGVVLALAIWIALRGRQVDVNREATAFSQAAAGASRADRERLKAEFSVAKRAQQQMLPSAPPAIPGYDIAAICRPAREVGGDLYDFLLFSDGRYGVVVADVSGKGVPAAVYMTLTKGLLASVSEHCDDPGEILREVNRHLYRACNRQLFVTLFLGIIDPATNTLTFSRAGHNPPVWRQAAMNQTSLLRPQGIGLGLDAGNVFDRCLAVEQIQFSPSDGLFLYSDGISEAMNSHNEEYGEDRLMRIAAKTDGLGAAAARDLVLADVGEFLGRTAPQDDQTLVVVRLDGKPLTA
jgi:serine phosphatase RsbU (regulator of sigma subunit)